MATSGKDLEEIRQYLLGTLSGEARQRVEERLLLEEDFLEELLSGEDELIDQYLHQTLSQEERDGFERHFLSTPERLQKLRFGKAFGRYISGHSEVAYGETIETRYAADATADDTAAVAVAARLPTEPTRAERFRAFWSGQTWGLRAGLALASVVIITGALWVSLTPRAPRTFATLALNISAGNRADSTPTAKVTLPLGVDALRISLALPGGAAPPATHYRAELMDVDGGIKPLQIVGQDAQSVSVLIPAAELSRGQYALKLYQTGAQGTEQPFSGNYLFNVE